MVRLMLHSSVLMLLMLAAVISGITGDASASAFFFVALLAWAATLRANPLARILEQRFIRETRCPVCGGIVDLVDTWACGCGYVDAQPRHAFSACPSCHKAFKFLVCRCGGSIPY